jgi:hypothetical protein
MLLGGNLCSLSSIEYIFTYIKHDGHPLLELTPINRKTDLFDRSFDLAVT